MCGILAIHDPAGGITEAELCRGLAVLRHRGPDGEGLWISPTTRSASATPGWG